MAEEEKKKADKKAEDGSGKAPKETPEDAAKKEKPEETKEPPKAEKKEEKSEKGENESSKERKGKEESKGEKGKEEKPSKKKESKSSVEVTDATPAQVVKVFKKVGLYGECYQVLVRVLEGKDRGNLLRRNVRGAIKENDIIMLKETERDVRAV